MALSVVLSVPVEFTKICQAVGMGFLMMGFIAYFIKLIHIPINNIIVYASLLHHPNGLLGEPKLLTNKLGHKLCHMFYASRLYSEW